MNCGTRSVTGHQGFKKCDCKIGCNSVMPKKCNYYAVAKLYNFKCHNNLNKNCKIKIEYKCV